MWSVMYVCFGGVIIASGRADLRLWFIWVLCATETDKWAILLHQVKNDVRAFECCRIFPGETCVHKTRYEYFSLKEVVPIRAVCGSTLNYLNSTIFRSLKVSILRNARSFPISFRVWFWLKDGSGGRFWRKMWILQIFGPVLEYPQFTAKSALMLMLRPVVNPKRD